MFSPRGFCLCSFFVLYFKNFGYGLLRLSSGGREKGARPPFAYGQKVFKGFENRTGRKLVFAQRLMPLLFLFFSFQAKSCKINWVSTGSAPSCLGRHRLKGGGAECDVIFVYFISCGGRRCVVPMVPGRMFPLALWG